MLYEETAPVEFELYGRDVTDCCGIRSNQI